MRLQKNLLLSGYISSLLGSTFDGFAQVDEGRRPDGQSYFYGFLESRESRLSISLHDLRRYDLNILTHQETLAKYRPGFRLKYFQYLAALYTEIYLDRFTQDQVGLLLEINAYRQAHFSNLPQYEAADLYKLAFWMATGAGKTLLLHLNLLQFQHYQLFEPVNILLLTPTRTLTEQHLEELEKSGIEATYTLRANPRYQNVQVLEITKLYVEGERLSDRKGGDSLPTSYFDAPNLLLVDEGHKGTATQSNAREERAWRTVRESLASGGGFTFEYSATFGQVTEDNDELFHDYSKTILFEYAYRRFYADGYGKDYWVINIKEQAEFYGDTLLLAGLLTFYEKYHYYNDHRQALEPYLLDPPLFVFVGAQVRTSKSEVVEVIRFLDRVLREPDWVIQTISNILAGKSSLPSPNGNHAFGKEAFPYLKQLAPAPNTLYTDLLQCLFRGTGRLFLHILRQAEGEIGLRTADSTQDAYCGVINVGDASGLLKKVQAETDISVGEDDHLTNSLFDEINAPQSPINFLIGSKKFMEGWNSWRVSMMGLLKVGSNAGSQVIQLFGRGVRLKGQDSSLKRSQTLPGSHPDHIQLLETLHIFGLKANYLQKFLDTLQNEEIEAPVLRILPLEVDVDRLEKAGLLGLDLDRYNFKQQVIAFDPVKVSVTLDLNILVMIANAEGTATAKDKTDPEQLPTATLQLLSQEMLFDYALKYKARKGWENLYISRESVKAFFESSAKLAAPEEVLRPTKQEHLPALNYAAQALLEKGLGSFYYQHQRHAETVHLKVAFIASNHAKFLEFK